MATPLSMEAQHALKLLADCAWHPYEEVLSALAATVAPGKGLRRYQAFVTSRERTRGPRKGPGLSDDEKILAGQRSIAAHVLYSLQLRYIEVEGERRCRQVRRRVEPLPVVRRGGNRVADDQAQQTLQDPDDADSEENSPPVPPDTDDPHHGPAVAAFLSEDMLRALIADEVGVALEVFMQRLQSWLGVRFADLERRLRPSAPRD